MLIVWADQVFFWILVFSILFLFCLLFVFFFLVLLLLALLLLVLQLGGAVFSTVASQPEGLGFESRLWPFCVEFACFPCARVGFLRAHKWSPTKTCLKTYWNVGKHLTFPFSRIHFLSSVCWRAVNIHSVYIFNCILTLFTVSLISIIIIFIIIDKHLLKCHPTW